MCCPGMPYASIFDKLFGLPAFLSHLHGQEAEKRKFARLKEEKVVFGEYLSNNGLFYPQ